MRIAPAAALLAALAGLAACREAPAPSAPPAGDPPAAGPEQTGNAAPGESRGAGPAAGGPRAAKPPLPARPRDEAERLKGLVRLLEWGDVELVEFAQDEIAAFPDRDAAAAAIRAAVERNLAANLSFVFNLLGAIQDRELGERLDGVFLRCFSAPDPNVKSRAVLEYSKVSPGPSLEAMAALGTEGWAPVAQSAFRALENHRGPAAAAALRAVFPRVGTFARAAACNALGRLGDPASIPLLREEMAAAARGGESEVGVRIGCLQALARLSDPRGLAALRDYVGSFPPDRPAVPLDVPEEDWDGPEVVLSATRDGVLKGRLLAQARGAPPDAAAAAVRLLSRAWPADEETVGAHLAALERRDADAVLVAEALDALRRSGSADAVTRALALLQGPSVERRYGAALALGRFRDPATVRPLTERLAAETDPGVSRKICDALGILGDPSAAPALVRFLKGDPAVSPERALMAFEARVNLRGAVADAAAEDLAGIVARGATPAMRFHAARALGQCTRTERARPALEALLADPDPSLRCAAADALGLLGDPAARDPLALAYAREADEAVLAPLRDAILRLDLRNPR